MDPVVLYVVVVLCYCAVEKIEGIRCEDIARRRLLSRCVCL